MLIQLHGTLRGESGVRQIAIELPGDATVGRALLAALTHEPRLGAVILDGPGQIRRDLFILRNGRDVRLLRGMDTQLAASDRLDLFPLTGAQRAFA